MNATLSPIFTWRTAIAKSDLPPTVRHVALTLSLYMNERGGSAWPSIATLAEDSGLSTRTIMRGIRVLERDRYLLCERRPGTSTLYTGIVPTQLTLGDSLTGVTLSPPSEWHPTPVTTSPHPGHSVTQSSQERANTTPEGQRPSPEEPPASQNGKGNHPLDALNLGLVESLWAMHRGWDRKLSFGYLQAMTTGSEERGIPAFGARVVNAAIESLYENHAGAGDPAGYLRSVADALSLPDSSSSSERVSR